MTHFMKCCPSCNVIWEQCRCADPSKAKTMELCPDCKTKGTDCNANPEPQDSRTS
jgi:hypothetical protein